MEPIPIVPLACANWIAGSAACILKGRSACSKCHLVVYCGTECQKRHWAVHKNVCKSDLIRANWRPAWDREGYQPAWESTRASRAWHNPFGGEKYLWGNVPAIDVLRLPENEGNAYPDDISLLFAASGDLRHVIETVVGLRDGPMGRIQVTLNDREFEVVARNAVLLLFALTAPTNNPTADEATTFDVAESLIHLWYSALIPARLLSQLQSRIKPLITEVCRKIASKAPGARLAKTWQLGPGRSLRLVLTKEEWLKLEKLLEASEQLTCDEATNIRTAVTLAPERADYRDRWYFKEATPSMRLAKQRFREDGLLLPFGHPRTGFDTPNPTLFQANGYWSMCDKSDPLDGWPMLEIRDRPFPAKEDCYGQLFVYLRKKLKSFLERLAVVNINFEMHCVDVRELPQYLERDKYTRIEASNISDTCYLGIRETLARLCSLLQLPQKNPHATLITLFLNAVMEVVKMDNEQDEIPNMKLLMEYLPTPNVFSLLSRHSADMLRIWDARNLVLDVDTYFERYRALRRFDQIAAELNIAEKESNTVTERWPMRLKLQPGQEGAREEFALLLASGWSGMERYVEWRREEPSSRRG
ncbi:hypothetical protein QBC47DRAFT_303201 [Echria macrotheca]|uniref:MYND-type domain-containing protein n=1 Tax=Echria macrotheca TaxID=438768 RepID=A0AAJ0B9Q2_9PEZI|nr:hypothetical protein QBC47DRAFT_303201 [Echria macrotheca]